MSQRQQVSASAVSLTGLSSCVAHAARVGGNYGMVEGGVPGTKSQTSAVLSSTNALQIFGSFTTQSGDPGTSTYDGSCVMRWNITTSNTNITWSELLWTVFSASGVYRQCVTMTNTLAIGLGTTGVKTASVGVVAFVALTTDVIRLVMGGSNAAVNTQSFVWQPSELIDLPFSASAAASESSVPSLTILGAGQ